MNFFYKVLGLILIQEILGVPISENEALNHNLQTPYKSDVQYSSTNKMSSQLGPSLSRNEKYSASFLSDLKEDLDSKKKAKVLKEANAKKEADKGKMKRVENGFDNSDFIAAGLAESSKGKDKINLTENGHDNSDYLLAGLPANSDKDNTNTSKGNQIASNPDKSDSNKGEVANNPKKNGSNNPGKINVIEDGHDNSDFIIASLAEKGSGTGKDKINVMEGGFDNSDYILDKMSKSN